MLSLRFHSLAHARRADRRDLLTRVSSGPIIFAVTGLRPKVDLKREIATYTARPGEFSIVTVPRSDYLMIDGHGDPNTSTRYADALAALYPLAYKLKFLSKTELGRDYVVMPLEGLWWSADLASFTSDRDKSRWDWTLMIMVPSWLTDHHLEAARASAARAGHPAVLDEVRREPLDEGLCVQTLHVGSYDDEAPVVDAMHHEFLPAHGLRLAGRHHEVYLSDPRRTPPARLRTILRQPVTTAPA